MYKSLFTILIAFLAGMGGAYVFQRVSPASSHHVALTNEHTNRLVNYSGVNLDSEVSFVNASAISTPAVVYIKTIHAQQASYNWFDFFFNGTPQSQMVISSGSGVIYSKDGYIITNNHVIDKADQVEVIHNKRTYKAKIVGVDPSSDLAVLKIEAEDLPSIKIGSSRMLAVGDWVLAVGNPFNLESTVTAGIVSAKGRSINILRDRFPIESFIQTDAAINPGNSGGALVNLAGELVGINTAILSQTGSYAGYGFAVPVDIVKKIVEDMIKYGSVQKSFFGANVAETNAEMIKQAGLKEIAGVVVTKVLADGSADKMGLQKGDIILEINDHKIDNKPAFDEELSYHRPGEKIKVKFRREDKTIEGSLLLTNMEGTTALLRKESYYAENLGVEIETVPKVERARLGIENGVRLLKVAPNGFVARLGIDQGFIVTAINNKKILSVNDFAKTLEQIRGRVIIEGVTADGQRGYYSFIF